VTKNNILCDANGNKRPYAIQHYGSQLDILGAFLAHIETSSDKRTMISKAMLANCLPINEFNWI
jgi:hypothetical protein